MGLKSDRPTTNYSPVSLTSVYCKIVESLIRDHVMNYLLENDLLSNNKQYGFIKGQSTMLQLLQITNKWTEYLEKDGQNDTIHSDFEKASIKSHRPHRRFISGCLSNCCYCADRAQNLPGTTPNNVLRVLQISSNSVHFRRSSERLNTAKLPRRVNPIFQPNNNY